MSKLKRKDLPAYRETLRKEQHGVCPLCRQKIVKEEAVLDHDHVTGHCRAALHSHCNSMEGKFANWLRTFGKEVDPKVFLDNLAKYWDVDYSDKLVHPLHRTETDKKIRVLNRRLRNAKKDSTKQRIKQLIEEVKNESSN